MFSTIFMDRSPTCVEPRRPTRAAVPERVRTACVLRQRLQISSQQWPGEDVRDGTSPRAGAVLRRGHVGIWCLFDNAKSYGQAAWTKHVPFGAALVRSFQCQAHCLTPAATSNAASVCSLPVHERGAELHAALLHQPGLSAQRTAWVCTAFA